MTSAGALDLWEAGLMMTPAARTVLLLEAAGHAGVADWPVGRSNQALLSTYCAPRGSLAAVTECPACGTSLELDLDPRQLSAQRPIRSVVTVQHEAHRVTTRPPTAGDLAHLSARTAPADLGAVLLERCVVAAESGDSPAAPADLPDSVVDAVDAALADADPDADLGLTMSCAECGAEWVESLDPVHFAWSAVEETARSLATDVHTLARAYGWSEVEILQLSPFRRHLYLSAVQS